MSPDDLGGFKYNLYVKAMNAVRSDEVWGSWFGGNCLPACRAIFDDVKAEFPQARIIVGLAERTSQAPDCSAAAKNAILQFLLVEGFPKPDFHAWIDMDGCDLFDPIGASWLGGTGLNACAYLDAGLAQKHCVKYVPVLVAPEETEAFYSRLLSLQRKTN